MLLLEELTKALEEIEGVAKQTTTYKKSKWNIERKVKPIISVIRKKNWKRKIDSYLKVDLKA